jgi:hypothetical protein
VGRRAIHGGLVVGVKGLFKLVSYPGAAPLQHLNWPSCGGVHDAKAGETGPGGSEAIIMIEYLLPTAYLVCSYAAGS